jgi:hypothetical protein
MFSLSLPFVARQFSLLGAFMIRHPSMARRLEAVASGAKY